MQGGQNRFSARIRKVPARYTVPASLIIALLACWWLLPLPQTVFALSTRTEIVKVKVTNPQAASFGVRHALLLGPGGRWQCLTDATITPQLGATVQYVRFGLDAVTITIDDAPTQVTPAQGRAPGTWAGTASAPLLLRLDPTSDTCPAPRLLRLPLFGTLVELGDETSFGGDPGSPRLVLLSGTVRMLVRALTLPLSADEGELFAVDQMVLPAGSVVHSASGLHDRPADWWGFVDVLFDEVSERGLQVEAASHAQSVAITLPAALGSNGGTEDQRSLSVSFADRWASDPGLRLVAMLSAAAALLATLGDPGLKLLRGIFRNETR